MKNDFLNYPELAPIDEKANKLMIFLHGLGSDGHDLIGLAPFFQRNLKDCHFISPHGIEQYDMMPFGRQWFSLKDRSYDVISKLIEQNINPIENLIKEIQSKFSIDNANTILVGFSQGAMISLYLALTTTSPYMAVAAFSGKLFIPEKIFNKNTPICLVHGKEDDIVLSVETQKAYDYLEKNGVYCSKLIIPSLAHSIDSRGIEFCLNFFNEVLK